MRMYENNFFIFKKNAIHHAQNVKGKIQQIVHNAMQIRIKNYSMVLVLLNVYVRVDILINQELA